MRGYPADSPFRDIATARRLTVASRELLGRRIRIFVSFAETVTTEQENL